MQPTALKIILAANPLFNRNGLRKTTIDDIARDAGIGKGTVYNYFKDKEEIYLTAKRHECQQFMSQLRSAIRREQTASGQLLAFIKSWFQQTQAYRMEYPLSPDLFAEFEQVPECAIIVGEYNRDQSSLIRGIIETGVESREFVSADIETSCWSVMVALSGLSVAHYMQGFIVAPSEMPSIVGNMLVRALSQGSEKQPIHDQVRIPGHLDQAQ